MKMKNYIEMHVLGMKNSNLKKRLEKDNEEMRKVYKCI